MGKYEGVLKNYTKFFRYLLNNHNGTIKQGGELKLILHYHPNKGI